MISLDNITVYFGEKAVVRKFSATAENGQFIALVGPNGAGKSSLLKAIAGLLPHDGTTSLPTDRAGRARHLAYLPQKCVAPNYRKVEDIIALGRTPFLGPLSRLSEDDEVAILAASKSCETDMFFGRTYGTLSGGEQMRVHLSRALATQAPLLLADEPIAALDPYYQISTLNILRESAYAGTTIIAALHDLKLAERFADRIWVMDSGQLVQNAPADTALSENILRDVFRITPDGKIIA